MALPVPDLSTLAPYAGWVVAILLLIEKIANFVSGRKEAKARIHKTEAEADEIHVRASISLGEKTVAWTQQMMRAQEIIISQDKEIRALQDQNEHLMEENLILRSDARKVIGGS